jgi:tRNA modification GTPase
MASADLLLWLGSPDEQPEHPTAIVVHARADERGDELTPLGAIATSVRDGTGVAELRQLILDEARKLLPPPDGLSMNRRQAAALAEAVDAMSLIRQDDPLLTAEALRQALHALDRLSGRQTTEDVLDALFGRFCLGK